jgi:hypothetical protein
MEVKDKKARQKFAKINERVAKIIKKIIEECESPL